MGLDMYLKGRRYVSRWFNKGDEDIARNIAEQFPELAAFQNEEDPVINEVTAEVGYWRKANAIHKWFVDNVQSGEDNCQPYYVSREELEKLKEVCERVVGFKHLAETQLPTAQGCFFGSTSYDEWYYDDVQRTIDIINRCLALPKQWEFEYRASW